MAITFTTSVTKCCLRWSSNPLRPTPQGPTGGPTSHFRWLSKAKGQQGFGQNHAASKGLICGSSPKEDFWGWHPRKLCLKEG